MKKKKVIVAGDAPAVVATTSEKKLESSEQQALDQLEATIREGNKAPFAVGQALKEIRDKKLYRENGRKIDVYCTTVWSMSYAQADPLIKQFDVMEILTPLGGVLPLNEAQVRPLTRLKKISWCPPGTPS